MIKLNTEQRSLAENLVTEDIPFVVINMLFQRGLGDVWVDRFDTPATVIAAFPRDCYCLGDLLTPSAQMVLKGIGGSTPATPGLREALQKAWGSFAVIPSLEFEYVGAGDKVRLVPEGYLVAPIDRQNISQVMELWQDDYPTGIIGDFADMNDFFQNSFGACVIHEQSGTCVSACAAISVSRERCDYGLDTHAQHAGLGLATACSTMAVELALRHGKKPVWITEKDNIASQRVAQKIGFVKKREFYIYKRVYAVDGR